MVAPLSLTSREADHAGFHLSLINLLGNNEGLVGLVGFPLSKVSCGKLLVVDLDRRSHQSIPKFPLAVVMNSVYFGCCFFSFLFLKGMSNQT